MSVSPRTDPVPSSSRAAASTAGTPGTRLRPTATRNGTVGTGALAPLVMCGMGHIVTVKAV